MRSRWMAMMGLVVVCWAPAPAGAVSIVEHPTLPGDAAVTTLVAAPDGRLFFDVGEFSWAPGTTGRPGIGVYDPATGEARRIAIPDRPFSLAVAHGALWAAAMENSPIPTRFTVYRVDLASGAVQSLDLGRISGLAASPSGDTLYAVRDTSPVSSSSVQVIAIDSAGGARPVKTLAPGTHLGQIGIANDGAIWVSYYAGETQDNGVGTARRLVRIDQNTGLAGEYSAAARSNIGVPSPGPGSDMWMRLSRGTGFPRDLGELGIGHADPAAGQNLRELPTAVANTTTGGFAVGPDNAIWYGTVSVRAGGGGGIVRLDPETGVQRVFAPPSAQSGLTSVTRSADGRSLWFAGGGRGSNLTEVNLQADQADTGNSDTVTDSGLFAPVDCPTACRGSAIAQVNPAGSAARVARARHKTIARVRFARNGNPATRLLTLRLNRAGRAQLRRHRTVRVAVRVRVRAKHGRTRTTTRRLVLRRPPT